ncbi:MAG TPA: acyclic terpene utilization AtuA family protein, partial [Polyangiaceae bacterium]|nr:acyclic terpene utilization AtuA family protein [Polyangiaceae bacterium]
MASKPAVRIANASGFLGDRASALREMAEGGQVDFITGDYLAELTMLILGKQQMKDPAAGYASTFLAHLEPALSGVLAKGIKIVVNAGGLNPLGLAKAVRALGERLGVAPRVATVQGDDLRMRLPTLLEEGERLANLETGAPLPREPGFVLTANAYLGAWGIVRALEAGADIVVCPRVTDASLVVGAAAFWHGWRRDQWDCLAGAVAAGHVIECGTQATGGNYSSFREIEDL